jgi:hypothetical protein
MAAGALIKIVPAGHVPPNRLDEEWSSLPQPGASRVSTRRSCTGLR